MANSGLPPASATALAASSGPSTLGTTTKAAFEAATAAKSASAQGVPKPFTRIPSSRAPNPSAAAATAASRAAGFMSGATASSRSSITTSAGRVRAFSIARALEAGR